MTINKIHQRLRPGWLLLFISFAVDPSSWNKS